MSRHAKRAVAIFGAAMLMVGVYGLGASAANGGNIDHAETSGGSFRVLYSLPELPDGVDPDLSSLVVSVNGSPVDAEAEVAAAADPAEQVRRTAIMAIDTSNSMRGDRFTQAKVAAQAFLDSAPEDVHVGIVAFAGSVDVVHSPSLDRIAASAVLDELNLSLETRLYDGVIAAAAAAGSEGQRRLLVLSDGRDTSSTNLEDAVQAIAESDVRVDVVALGEEALANPPLEAMAGEGDGSVIPAEDPEALTRLFNEEAAALARQVLVTAVLPDGVRSEGSLTVSIDAGGETYSDTAFVSFGARQNRTDDTNAASGPKPVAGPQYDVSAPMMVGGLVLGGTAVLLLLASALGALGPHQDELESHIAAYTRAGAAKSARSRLGSQAQGGATSRSVKGSAVQAAQKALESNRGVEAALGVRLEAAGMALRPAEWLLLHAGAAVGAALLGFLFSSGGILPTMLLFIAGTLFPWMYLRVRRSRRLKAFDGQLAETLQLISGSLSAGLSLAQGIDTVVREGAEPVASEFRKALIQARLGVPIEDALDDVAERMESDDFHWVVMAIRIQREVGGNLAELLLTVAGTLREREYLRRQVKTLSAEGRMSAWILGALPPGFMVYLSLVNADYMTPMFSTPIGWFLLGTMGFLLALGVFWMSKVVKVEV